MLSQFPTTFKVSFILATITLGIAIYIRYLGDFAKPYGYILVGAWILIPPIWFLYEYQKSFPKDHGILQEEVDRLKDLHVLSRNIWLAFVVVLAAIMEIDIFNGVRN